MKKISAFILCAVLVLAMCVGASALGPEGEERIQGIDVSIYQGEIDFARVRSAGIEAVYVRGSVGGSRTDERFAQNVQAAKAAGLSVGAYAYITARTPAQARAQAQRFAALLDGLSLPLRPAADFNVEGLSRAQANAVALAYLSELKAATGVTPLLYTNASSAQNLWSEALTAYPLWVADYNKVSEPQVRGKWSGWAGWQHSNTGRVAGIQGDVDLDVFTEAVFSANSETPPTHRTYTVRRGDTLSSIARLFGVTPSSLARENALANPNLIYPGQVLILPDGAAGVRAITVDRGDTLSRLARRYGSTVSALARLNRIENVNRIFAGQTLLVPA